MAIAILQQHLSYLISAMQCQNKLGCTGLRGSEITLYGDISPQMPPPIEKLNDRSQVRTKMKTNGYFTTYKQVHHITCFFYYTFRCEAMLLYTNHISNVRYSAVKYLHNCNNYPLYIKSKFVTLIAQVQLLKVVVL